MANSVSKHVGQSLVVAKLRRMGLLATTFTDNLPGIHVLAYNRHNKKALPLKVMSIKRGKFSVDAKHYLDIRFEDKKQIVLGFAKDIDPNLICVFVLLGQEKKPRQFVNNKFYILTNRNIAKLVKTSHGNFLKKHNGIRPRNPSSTHSGLREERLLPFADNWDLIRDRLGA